MTVWGVGRGVGLGDGNNACSKNRGVGLGVGGIQVGKGVGGGGGAGAGGAHEGTVTELAPARPGLLIPSASSIKSCNGGSGVGGGVGLMIKESSDGKIAGNVVVAGAVVGLAVAGTTGAHEGVGSGVNNNVVAMLAPLSFLHFAILRFSEFGLTLRQVLGQHVSISCAYSPAHSMKLEEQPRFQLQLFHFSTKHLSSSSHDWSAEAASEET